jgi:alanine-synthesizing transaminase
LGMGNPSDGAPQIVIDKLCEAARDPRNHRYSASKGVKKAQRRASATCVWRC